jgi:alpha-tubulin suppressor-like RCC1 family protein
VRVGMNHYAMVDYSGYLWVCGDNANGCLGVGDSNKRT